MYITYIMHAIHFRTSFYRKDWVVFMGKIAFLLDGFVSKGLQMDDNGNDN